MRGLMIGAALTLMLALPALGATQKAHAIARLSGADGSAMGTVNFSAAGHAVLIEYDLKGLTPGPHAIHVHMTGACDAKTGFASAGSHYSVDLTRTHGFLTDHGPHEGDLPNEWAASDGTLKASVTTSQFTLGNGKKSLFDADGAALIVHAKADDYTSQPAGASGDRVACGVIYRTIGPSSRKGGTRKAHK